MPMRLTMELSETDLAGLAARFHAADARITKEVQAAAKTWGEYCKQLTKEFCPVDTEWMRDHVRTEYLNNGLTFETGWSYDDFVGHGNSAFYPYYQEFGTVNHAAQPSLGPASEIVMPLYRADVSAALRRAVERISVL
jgi:HK97 gp10 family phage protein